MDVTSRELPMFPLGMVVFPHQQLGLYVFEARYQQMLADLDTESRFGTCLICARIRSRRVATTALDWHGRRGVWPPSPSMMAAR